MDDFYRENILDHYRNPRNKGRLENPTHMHEEHNPLCGDVIRIDLHVNEQDVIDEVRFDGQGCAISRASASMMVETLGGRPVDEALALQERFLDMMDPAGPGPTEGDREVLGDLVALEGVRQYPARVQCATLAWDAFARALAAALEQRE